MRSLLFFLLIVPFSINSAQNYINVYFTDAPIKSCPVSSMRKITFSSLGDTTKFLMNNTDLFLKKTNLIRKIVFSDLGYGSSFFKKTLNLTALLEGYYKSAQGKQIPDTILVILRNSNDHSVVDSSSGVLDSSGNAAVVFSNARENTGYYLVLKHFTNIETWSDISKLASTQFVSSTMTYNFSDDSSKAYGNNLVKYGSKWCLYSGDVNQDGKIDSADIQLVCWDSYNYATGRRSTDINGDKTVDLSDIIFVDNNYFNHVAVCKPGAKIFQRQNRSDKQ